MNNVMPRTKGIAVLIEDLEKSQIEYQLDSDDGMVDTIWFFKEGVEFSALVANDYILASADATNLLTDDENLLKQVKEYIHRCNHSYKFAKFDYSESMDAHRVFCTSERWFSDANMGASVVGSIEAITEMTKRFASGINEVITGQGSAKDIFMKYQSQERPDNE